MAATRRTATVLLAVLAIACTSALVGTPASSQRAALSRKAPSAATLPTRVLAVHEVRPAPRAVPDQLPAPPRRRVHEARVPACVDTGAGWRARRGAKALAQLDYPWRQLGYDIRFEPARTRLLGFTDHRLRRVLIYVRSCRAESSTTLAMTLAHELGHAFDARYGTDARHAEWLRLRGIPAATPWYPMRAVGDDFGYGCGDFAEVFASALVRQGMFMSRLAPRPTSADLVRLRHLLEP
jgi:hypothetical protein